MAGPNASTSFDAEVGSSLELALHQVLHTDTTDP